MEKTNQNQNSQKAEPKKEEAAKSLNGTEKSGWEKAAENITGNNEVMKGVMKFLLSPVTLIICAGAVIYFYFKNREQKKEIERLKEENTKLLNEKRSIEEKAEKHKKNFIRLEKLFELDQQRAEQKALPHGNSQMQIHNVNKNRVAYLR